MAHIGLTPQSVYGLGGYKVQGRGEAAHAVLDQAHNLEKAGAFAIVLEAMPAELGGEITRRAADPDDRHRGGPRHRRPGARDQRPARASTRRAPKLAKKYADLRAVMTDAVDVVHARRRRRAPSRTTSTATPSLPGSGEGPA